MTEDELAEILAQSLYETEYDSNEYPWSKAMAKSIILKMKEIKKSGKWDRTNPCPLCGFYIAHRPRQPFVIDEDDWD
jgi:hypothetical protein